MAAGFARGAVSATASSRFKLLCAEAWEITLNSWQNVGSYMVAVCFNTMNRNYRLLLMTCDYLNRQYISDDEEKLHKILYEKISNKYKRW